MTTHQIYAKALEEFNFACDNYRTLCERIKDGKDNEFAANAALNNVIALGWRLKDAALLREPAPLPPRAVKSAAKKEK